MTDITSPGQQYTAYLDFYNEQSGALTDPSAVALDITYGGELGLVPDAAGPFYYSGSSVPVGGQVYRLGTGQYACTWNVPVNAPPGAYVANWTCTYGPDGDEFLVTDNFFVTGGFPISLVAPGETGYWTGLMSYSPVYAPSGLNVSIGTGPDENGVSWIWQQITGWDSPDVAGQVVQRSADHGGWATSQYYAPRIIAVTIMAAAPTQALRDTARAALQQVIPVGISPGDMATLVYNEPIPKQAVYRRTGKITETYPTLCDVVFTCNLVCPDPRKYSAVQKSQTAYLMTSSPGGDMVEAFTVPFTLMAGAPPGEVVISNAGTFETRPTVTVTGPLTSPSISNLTYGMTVSFTGLTLASTDVLTLDMDAKVVYLNGAMRVADLASAWWVLQPGDNIIELAAPTSGAGASIAVSWRDAWI